MADLRVQNFAKLLVEHSVDIQPGDRILLETTILGEELFLELYKQIMEHGGHPYSYIEHPAQREILLTMGAEEQIRHVDQLKSLAYENFEARIRIWSESNTKATGNVKPENQSALLEAESPILKTQFKRGADESFKWLTTMTPTQAYAQQAGMGFEEYKDFFYGAAHVMEDDPVDYWKQIKTSQAKYAEALTGHDKVELRGPNVELSLSIKGRTWISSYGKHNMPDGEVYTGPVENSVNGWVRYTYPAQYRGTVVEGAELKFKDGKVVEANARTNQDFMRQVLKTDEGASYVGEFAIGLNDDIDRFTGFILLDEKIGGSFHMAVGAGYPQSGSKNNSAVHWDMICDLRSDSEILVDGEVFYKNGKFLI